MIKQKGEASEIEGILTQKEELDDFESSLYHPPKSTTRRTAGAISSFKCHIATGSAKQCFSFNITSENKRMISTAGTIPSLSFLHKINNLPLPLVILVPIFLPEDSFSRTQLQFSAKSSEKKEQRPHQRHVHQELVLRMTQIVIEEE